MFIIIIIFAILLISAIISNLTSKFKKINKNLDINQENVDNAEDTDTYSTILDTVKNSGYEISSLYNEPSYPKEYDIQQDIQTIRGNIKKTLSLTEIGFDPYTIYNTYLSVKDLLKMDINEIFSFTPNLLINIPFYEILDFDWLFGIYAPDIGYQPQGYNLNFNITSNIKLYINASIILNNMDTINYYIFENTKKDINYVLLSDFVKNKENINKLKNYFADNEKILDNYRQLRYLIFTLLVNTTTIPTTTTTPTTNNNYLKSLLFISLNKLYQTKNISYLQLKIFPYMYDITDNIKEVLNAVNSFNNSNMRIDYILSIESDDILTYNNPDIQFIEINTPDGVSPGSSTSIINSSFIDKVKSLNNIYKIILNINKNTDLSNFKQFLSTEGISISRLTNFNQNIGLDVYKLIKNLNITLEIAPLFDSINLLNISGTFKDMLNKPFISMLNYGVNGILSTKLYATIKKNYMNISIMAMIFGFSLQNIKTLVYNCVTLCGISDNRQIKEDLELKWNNYINEKWSFNKVCPCKSLTNTFRVWDYNDGESKEKEKPEDKDRLDINLNFENVAVISLGVTLVGSLIGLAAIYIYNLLKIRQASIQLAEIGEENYELLANVNEEIENIKEAINEAINIQETSLDEIPNQLNQPLLTEEQRAAAGIENACDTSYAEQYAEYFKCSQEEEIENETQDAEIENMEEKANEIEELDKGKKIEMGDGDGEGEEVGEKVGEEGEEVGEKVGEEGEGVGEEVGEEIGEVVSEEIGEEVAIEAGVEAAEIAGASILAEAAGPVGIIVALGLGIYELVKLFKPPPPPKPPKYQDTVHAEEITDFSINTYSNFTINTYVEKELKMPSINGGILPSATISSRPNTNNNIFDRIFLARDTEYLFNIKCDNDVFITLTIYDTLNNITDNIISTPTYRNILYIPKKNSIYTIYCITNLTKQISVELTYNNLLTKSAINNNDNIYITTVINNTLYYLTQTTQNTITLNTLPSSWKLTIENNAEKLNNGSKIKLLSNMPNGQNLSGCRGGSGALSPDNNAGFDWIINNLTKSSDAINYYYGININYYKNDGNCYVPSLFALTVTNNSNWKSVPVNTPFPRTNITIKNTDIGINGISIANTAILSYQPNAGAPRTNIDIPINAYNNTWYILPTPKPTTTTIRPAITTIRPTTTTIRPTTTTTPLITSKSQYIKNDFVQYTYTGTDIPNNNPIIGTLAECQNRCDNEQNCIGFSREKAALDTEIKPCYLKQSSPGVAKNDKTWNTYVKPEKLSAWPITTTTKGPI